MSKEIETRIKALIDNVNEVELLQQIRKHTATRIDLIHKRDRQAELDQLWEEIKSVAPGRYLEATKSVDMFYLDRRPAIQRTVHVGDRWLLWWSQPRAKRIWLIKPADPKDADYLQQRIREYHETPKGQRFRHQSTRRSMFNLASYLDLSDMARVGLRRADIDQTVAEA